MVHQNFQRKNIPIYPIYPQIPSILVVCPQGLSSKTCQTTLFSWWTWYWMGTEEGKKGLVKKGHWGTIILYLSASVSYSVQKARGFFFFPQLLSGNIVLCSSHLCTCKSEVWLGNEFNLKLSAVQLIQLR